MGFCADCEQTVNERAIKKETRTTVRGSSVVSVDFYYFECEHCHERYYINGPSFNFAEAKSDK